MNDPALPMGTRPEAEPVFDRDEPAFELDDPEYDMGDMALPAGEPDQQTPPLSGSAFSPLDRVGAQDFDPGLLPNQETAAIIDSASKDRRLVAGPDQRAAGWHRCGGPVLYQAPTPNLLIVESTSPREDRWRSWAQLAQSCDPGTKVIVIGHLNDVILYRELMREGVSEYIVAPISQLQIIESVSNLYNDPEAAPVGRVITFVGARGGSGSSTIAHNVGWAVSEHQDESVVVDLDLPFGTAGLNFNQDPPQGIAEALSSPERMDEVLLETAVDQMHRAPEPVSQLRAPLTAIMISTPKRWIRSSKWCATTCRRWSSMSACLDALGQERCCSAPMKSSLRRFPNSPVCAMPRT